MRVLYLSAVIVLIDQVTKLLVKGISIPFLNIRHEGLNQGIKNGNAVNISLVENPGLGFGINPGMEYKFELTLITLVLSGGLLIYLYLSRKEHFGKRLGTAFLIGGAAGNLIDRIFYGVIYGYAPFLCGNVVDFINIELPDLFFFGEVMGNYVFNVADLAVSVGLILFMFSFLKAEQNGMQPVTAENQE